MFYLRIYTGTTQFVLDHHHDDAEHAHDQRIVADAFPLLEQCFPPAESVADVRFVLRAGYGAARCFDRAAAEASLLHVPGTEMCAIFFLDWFVVRNCGWVMVVVDRR